LNPIHQGLIPQYGAGQFWNTYNINLPLDTLALAGALLEWGHAKEALQYIGWYLHHNIVDGKIDYKVSGLQVQQVSLVHTNTDYCLPTFYTWIPTTRTLVAIVMQILAGQSICTLER
jgi:hypothetical protein